MSKTMYCAVGDYGVEFASDIEQECRSWVAQQEKEEDLRDYYQIVTYTQAELDAMPEV